MRTFNTTLELQHYLWELEWDRVEAELMAAKAAVQARFLPQEYSDAEHYENELDLLDPLAGEFYL